MPTIIIILGLLYSESLSDELFTMKPSMTVETSKQSYDDSDSLQTSSGAITIYSFTFGYRIWRSLYLSYTYGQSLKVPLPWMSLPNDIKKGYIARVSRVGLLFYEDNVNFDFTYRAYPNGKTVSNGEWKTFDAHEYTLQIDLGPSKDQTLIPHPLEAYTIIQYKDYTVPRNWYIKTGDPSRPVISGKYPFAARSRIFTGGVDLRIKRTVDLPLNIRPNLGLLFGAGPSPLKTQSQAIDDSTDLYSHGADMAVTAICGLSMGYSLGYKGYRISASVGYKGSLTVAMPSADGIVHGFDYDGTRDQDLRDKNTRYRGINYTGNVSSWETYFRVLAEW